MTEKRDLNNELILMKKTVQQAKVCVIGKLVRKLKNITYKHGKDLTGLALMGKKSRLADQINYLKKTPNLELASLALTFNKNPSKILSNPLSSIEDASLANIVTFKAVGIKIGEIKFKFGLDDSGDDWRERVREIGKKKKKKIEKETNKNRNKIKKEEHKKRIDLVKKRDEWLMENKDTSEDTEPTKEFKENKSEKSNDKNEKISKSANSSSGSGKKVKEPPYKKFKSESSKIVDPFFITDTGESYLATSVASRIQPSGPNDGLDRKERRAQQFGSKPKTVSKSHDVHVTLASSQFNESKTQAENIHPSWAAKMKAKGIDKFQGKKITFGEEEPMETVDKPVQSQKDSETLHPSWVAKQKLKPVISEFKGSKIVFDD